MKIVKKIRKKRRKLIRRFFKSPIKKPGSVFQNPSPFSQVLEKGTVYKTESLLLVALSRRNTG